MKERIRYNIGKHSYHNALYVPLEYRLYDMGRQFYKILLQNNYNIIGVENTDMW